MECISISNWCHPFPTGFNVFFFPFNPSYFTDTDILHRLPHGLGWIHYMQSQHDDPDLPAPTWQLPLTPSAGNTIVNSIQCKVSREVEAEIKSMTQETGFEPWNCSFCNLIFAFKTYHQLIISINCCSNKLTNEALWLLHHPTTLKCCTQVKTSII